MNKAIPIDDPNAIREYALVELVGRAQKIVQSTTKQGTPYIRGSFKVRVSKHTRHYFPFIAFDEDVIATLQNANRGDRFKISGVLQQYRKSIEDGGSKTNISYVQIKVMEAELLTPSQPPARPPEQSDTDDDDVLTEEFVI